AGCSSRDCQPSASDATSRAEGAAAEAAADQCGTLTPWLQTRMTRMARTVGEDRGESKGSLRSGTARAAAAAAAAEERTAKKAKASRRRKRRRRRRRKKRRRRRKPTSFHPTARCLCGYATCTATTPSCTTSSPASCCRRCSASCRRRCPPSTPCGSRRGCWCLFGRTASPASSER
ncbi:unnamed protein product, partial [Ectocarpus fasciculatus]